MNWIKNLKPKTYHLQPQQGFTLIELLVSIAVMATLSGIVIANFRANEKTAQMNAAKDTVVNALRSAQLYALSGKKIDASTCAPGGISNKSAAYYEMRFTHSNQFILLAEDRCNIPHTLETYTLPSQITIPVGGLTLNSTAAASSLYIKFTPPFAVVTGELNGAGGMNFTTATIMVQSVDGRETTVIVDGISGRIDEGATTAGGDANP